MVTTTAGNYIPQICRNGFLREAVFFACGKKNPAVWRDPVSGSDYALCFCFTAAFFTGAFDLPFFNAESIAALRLANVGLPTN